MTPRSGDGWRWWTRALTAAAVALTLLLSAGVAPADAGPFTLANGYVSLRGEGAALTDLRFDAGGQGRYGRNLVRDLQFGGLTATPDSSWTRDGDALTLTGLTSCRDENLDLPNGGQPEMLQPGGTLGQSFRVAAGSLRRVTVLVPTWHAQDSGAMLRLRRGGPDGEVVAERRMADVPDNSPQSLDFAPQPPGGYYVEMAEPRGQIGWWGNPKDVYPEGSAFVSGQPAPERERTLTAAITRTVGIARLTLALAGPRLTLAATETLDGQAAALPLALRLPWESRGYDVSAKAVPFARFYTDNQRYLCIEQFKRSPDLGLSLGPCQWIEADGTGAYDLRFAAAGLRAGWTLTPDLMTMSFGLDPRPAEGQERTTSLTITAQPRDDALPPEWPAFETPDARVTTDLNRFFYERAFSYPSPAGPAAWYEWSALIRFWFAGPAHDGEAAGLTGAVVDDEGYVYTWGGGRGWPFPDEKQYDTRHFDSNARYILGCWRQLCWTHDPTFMRSELPRLRRAMKYQLTTLKGAEGLIVAASKDVNGRHKGVGNNYWDILPFGHLDAYANAVYYASLEAMAQIEELAASLAPEAPAPEHSAGHYRELAPLVREAYSRTFWDERAGRFIGCVDLDGQRHDYGFTFVNLETMAYGLASPRQAERIYDWMENGRTSSGRRDTYSRFIFAPRATTLHNPMWDEKGVKDPQAAGVDPWWHFGWTGTPFGEVQCQDGGAILYTSFFDLMARSRLLGADNAWRRWEAILGRYRLPDRLCGGPPLYRGEIPQQVNPGAVGVDLPFPESGLVPTWFLYGVAGVEATAEGLVIAPNLPDELPWLTIRNLCYRGAVMDLHVTNRSVSLVSRQPGREFTWRRLTRPGAKVVFHRPPR